MLSFPYEVRAEKARLIIIDLSHFSCLGTDLIVLGAEVWQNWKSRVWSEDLED